jgi:hypothetical protein
MDSDSSDGSSSVQIGGQEVMLKNKSYFKQSTGDEAGAAPQKGTVSTVNRGKVYFIAWSMDVKVEGENAVRNLDMTTHNHASPVANSPPQIFLARMDMANIPGCEGEKAEVQKACGENGEKFSCPDNKPHSDAKKQRKAMKDLHGKKSPQYAAANQQVGTEVDNMAAGNKADDCRKKMRCLLSPYDNDNCCPGQTPHHLVEAGAFHDQGRGGKPEMKTVYRAVFVRALGEPTRIDSAAAGEELVPSTPLPGAEKYDEGAAPCVCAEGESQHEGTHKLMHQAQGLAASNAPGVPQLNPLEPLVTASGKKVKMQTLDSAMDSGAQSVKDVFPESNCDIGCLKAQLKEYHCKQCEIPPSFPVKACGADGKALPA